MAAGWQQAEGWQQAGRGWQQAGGRLAAGWQSPATPLRASRERLPRARRPRLHSLLAALADRHLTL